MSYWGILYYCWQDDLKDPDPHSSRTLAVESGRHTWNKQKPLPKQKMTEIVKDNPISDQRISKLHSEHLGTFIEMNFNSRWAIHQRKKVLKLCQHQVKRMYRMKIVWLWQFFEKFRHIGIVWILDVGTTFGILSKFYDLLLHYICKDILTFLMVVQR